jgi:hypothetical protein
MQTVGDAAVSSEIAPQRLRDLEAGRATLGYGEALILARTYQLCGTCFAKHYRAAVARAGGYPDGEEE